MVKNMDARQKIQNILDSTQLATIATVNPTNLQPESALIAFVESDSLELYFQTGTNTRKFENLKINSKVSFVIGFGRTTVQYEVDASEVRDEAKMIRIRQLFLDKNSPTTAEFLNRPEISYFEVCPTWIGYSDYSHEKPIVFELTEF